MILGPDDKTLDAWAEALGSTSLVIAEPVRELVPEPLLLSLQERALQVSYVRAQVGRVKRRLAPQVRSDEIAWVNSANVVDAQWMRWLDALQLGLNRRLFLGLSHHESHYALYPPGARYHRHRDAFSAGQGSNRIVSLVLYLNDDWPESAGGELVLYPPDDAGLTVSKKLAPLAGRLVLFLSAEMPHEVLPSQQNRYSLAAWFRSSAPN